MNALMLRGDTEWTKNPAHISADRLLQIISPTDCNTSTIIENLEDHLYRWSVDGLIHMMIGDQDSSLLDPMVDIFATQLTNIFKTSAQLQFVSLSERDTTWMQFVKSVGETLEYARQIMYVALNKMNPKLGMLGRMSEFGMSREIIQRIFVDLIIAAGDTTAFSMQWMIYEVAKNKKLQNRIRYDMHVASLNNNDDSKYEINLIKNTIRETMRLYPVAPFIGRIIATDGVLGQYRVPKDVS